MPSYDLPSLLWAAWFVYWMIAARNASAAATTEGPARRAVHVVLLLVGFSLLLGFWRGWAPAQLFAPSLVTYVLGIGLEVVGLAFSVWARVHLGSNWSGTVTIKRDHALIRSGPYRLVRHPIYTGMLIAAVGTAMALDLLQCIPGIALVFAAFLVKIQKEEEFMERQFGAAYDDYRRDVRMLIPGIW